MERLGGRRHCIVSIMFVVGVCRRRPKSTEIACLEVTQLAFLIQTRIDSGFFFFWSQFLVADVFHLIV